MFSGGLSWLVVWRSMVDGIWDMEMKETSKSREAGFVYSPSPLSTALSAALSTNKPPLFTVHGEKHQDGDGSTHTLAIATEPLAHDGPAAHRHRQQRQRRRDQVGARRHCQEIPARPVVYAVAPAPDRPPRAGLCVGGARAVVGGVLAAREL